MFDGEIAKALEVGLTLKSDELFVLGDNRNHSYDSHDYGPVRQDRVIGKVVNIY